MLTWLTIFSWLDVAIGLLLLITGTLQMHGFEKRLKMGNHVEEEEFTYLYKLNVVGTVLAVVGLCVLTVING